MVDGQFQLSVEAEQVREVSRRLATELFRERAATIDRTEEYPWDNVTALVSHGLMGHTVDRQYGGGGGCLIEAIVAVEEVAKACGSTARIVVDTGDEWGPDARKTIEGLKPECAVLRFGDLASRPFEWPDTDPHLTWANVGVRAPRSHTPSYESEPR